MFECLICSKQFTEIPATATLVREIRGHKLYRFPDGMVHDLRDVNAFEQRAHLRFHKFRKRPDCVICRPEPQEQATGA